MPSALANKRIPFKDQTNEALETSSIGELEECPTCGRKFNE